MQQNTQRAVFGEIYTFPSFCTAQRRKIFEAVGEEVDSVAEISEFLPKTCNLAGARSRLGRGRLFKVDTHFTAVSRSIRFDQILKLLHRSVCRKLSECYESSSVVVFVCAKVIGVALNV